MGYSKPWFIDSELLHRSKVNLEDWEVLKKPDFSKSFREQGWEKINDY